MAKMMQSAKDAMKKFIVLQCRSPSMADLEVYFPDNTALHFTDQGVTDEDATICDSCDTKQFLSGGIVSDQIFICAKCRVADE